MSPREIFALREYLSPELTGRTISDARHSVSLSDILTHSCLASPVRNLSGRSVLLALSGQLLSALAMIELDGIASRMLLCPPDLNPDHVQALISDAEIDAIVTDQPQRWSNAGVYLIVGAHLPEHGAPKVATERATEWLMLTSGTSGVPKIVSHTLEGLTGAIIGRAAAGCERRVGDLLRYSPVWRAADLPPRRDRGWIDGAVRAP